MEEGRRYGSKLGGKRKKRRDLYKEGRKDKRGQQQRKERLGGNNVKMHWWRKAT